MKRKTGDAGYPIALVAVVGVMLLLGAFALTLVISGQPAFPVAVFGLADSESAESGARNIRPSDVSSLPRGRIDPSQLLPMPVVPVWKSGPWPADSTADPLYRAMAEEDAQKDLDRARMAAQGGRVDESVALYERLSQRFPANRLLLVERASVLAGVGRHTQAAQLLTRELTRYPRDVEVQMLAARNLWWSNQAVAADSVLGLTLSIAPNHVEALRLRETIRTTTQPDLATALRWRAEQNRPLENLLVARAYVQSQRYGDALAYYRQVIALEPPSDSLLLEAASAATAADSLQLVDETLTAFSARHPDDPAPPLQLARAYSWRGQHDRAVMLYDQSLAISRDPTVRLEKANVLMWSGREADAERELLALTMQLPFNPEVFKLLGDLAGYRADWAQSTAYYQRALVLDPDYPELTVMLARAAQQEQQARLAALPRPEPDAYSVSTDAYADNQSFRWTSVNAARSFRTGNTSFAVQASHTVTQSRPLGPVSTNPGFGFGVNGSSRFGNHFTARASFGVNQFDAIGTFASWMVGISVYDFLGATIAASYERQPALRRAGTLVALQAQAEADIAHLSISTTRGRWSGALQAEHEHFSSRVGGSNRLLGSARLTHTFTNNFSATAAMSGLRAGSSSPVLPDWGSLYWSPEYYLEPSIGIAYNRALSKSFSFGAGTHVGYAFLRERQGGQRFTGTSVPIMGGTLDLRYNTGPWTFDVTAGYSGALTAGYRAGSLRLQANYKTGR